jgi:hypothetical protein
LKVELEIEMTSSEHFGNAGASAMSEVGLFVPARGIRPSLWARFDWLDTLDKAALAASSSEEAVLSRS